MKFHSSVIFVKDIGVSKDFYTRLLGMKVEHDFGNNVILNDKLSLWCMNPNHQIARELPTAGNSNRLELYFEHDQVDDVYKLLSDNGVRFLHAVHEEPWGQKTIRFFDPDHHLIEVGEPLEVFVGRMLKEGLSPEQVSEKSGIPVETVRQLLS